MSTASQLKGRRSLFDAAIVRRASVDALVKLAPATMMKNPVMFVVEVGSVVTTVLLNAVILSFLLYRAAISRNLDLGFTGLVFKAAYVLFLLSTFIRARRLKRRVAALITAAANRVGLDRVFGKR